MTEMKHTDALMDEASSLIAELRRERDGARQAARDFEALYNEEYKTVDRCWQALGITNYAAAGGKAIFEIVAKQRNSHAALVAALEKTISALEIAGNDTVTLTVRAMAIAGGLESARAALRAAGR